MWELGVGQGKHCRLNLHSPDCWARQHPNPSEWMTIGNNRKQYKGKLLNRGVGAVVSLPCSQHPLATPVV